MAFEIYTPKKGGCTVSFAEYGLTFNKEAVDALNDPAYISIYTDPDMKMVLVKVAQKEDEFSFKFNKAENKTYVRINNKGFIRHVKTLVPDLDLTKSTLFYAMWDKAHGGLLIDLNSKQAEQEVEDNE